MEPDIDNFADILLDTYDINDGIEETIRESEPTNTETETEIKQEGTKIKKKKLDEEL